MGVEFRTKDDKTLRRAAQNYIVSDDKDNGGSSSGSHSSHKGSSSGGSSLSSSNEAASVPDENLTGDVQEQNANGVFAGGINAGLDGSLEAVNASNVIYYTVQEGDTLWKIAENMYGMGQYWEKIYRDNAELITDPDHIYVGWVLSIYPITETADIAEEVIQGETTYVVKPGDTLWKIAKEVYGQGWRWRRIYKANKGVISDPGSLHVGQTIVIPEK